LVIYTTVNDPAVVQNALSLNIQNCLIKPYTDEDVFRESRQACANPWRNLQFEEEKSFCAQMCCSPGNLRGPRGSGGGD